MRTTTANFKKAFQRGTQEPVVVARIHYRDSTGGGGGGGTTPEVLLHMDDDTDDSSGNGNNGTAANITYATSGAGGSGASGFDKAAQFNNSDSKITLGDLALGTGDVTISFWWWYGSNAGIAQGSQKNAMISTETWVGTSDGFFAIYHYDAFSPHAFRITQWNGATSYEIKTFETGTLTYNTWYHVAFVRRSNGEISLYMGEAGNATGSHVETITGTARTWGGNGEDMTIGRLGDGTGGAAPYFLDGNLDEFAITKDELYTGTGSYDLPTAPQSVGGVSVRTWDVSTDEIPGLGTPQEILSKQSDGLKPALLGITQIGQKLDPLTRTISTGNLSLTVAGRDVAAGLVPDPTAQAADQTFYRKLIQVYLAHPELTDPADWLQIFHGYTDDVVAVGGDALEFRCKNFEEIFKDSQWGGSLYSERPITQARTILNYAMLQGTIPEAELVLDGEGTGETFSPDNPQIAGTKSWAVTTLWSKMQSYAPVHYPGGRTRLMEGFPGPSEGDLNSASTAQTVSARDLLAIILRPYCGSIWINGAGQVVFQAFHTDTDRAFTEDQYQDFRQISGYTNAINKITMQQTRGELEYTLTRENAASIAKFGERPLECPNFPLMRSYIEPVAGAGRPFVLSGADGALINGGALQGFTGIKYNPEDFGELGYLLFAPWNQIASYDRLDTPGIYREIDTSAYFTQMTIAYVIYNADGSVKWERGTGPGGSYSNPDMLVRNKYANLDIVDTAIEGVPEWAGAGMFPEYFPTWDGRECSDVTQWRHYTGKILDRFSVGTPTASVVVDMSNADLEIGDIITMDNPEYSWEGFDDSDVLKWEITSIEFNPTEDNPGIRLELCAASQSGGEGFTTHTTKTDWTQPEKIPMGPVGSGKQPIGSVTGRDDFGVQDGLVPSFLATTSTVAIGAGAIDNGANEIQLRLRQGRISDSSLVPSGDLSTIDETALRFNRFNLDASTKYRIYAGRDPDSFIMQSLPKTSSDEFPIAKDQGVPVCEFTTDADKDPESASLIDLRELGTLIDASILPASVGGANLGFESWRRPTAAPDGWQFSGSPSAWGGYFTRYTADAKSGAQCLKVNTADGADLVSKWFKVKGGESRRLSFYHNPTTATSKVTQTSVEIEQRTRAWVALSSVSGAASGASAGTWYRNVSTHTLASSAAYFRFRIKRSGVASPVANDAILLDDLSFNKIERHGSKAALDTNLEINKLSTQTVVFNEAVSDTDGALVTSGGNQGLWFAPASGLYRAHWYLAAETCTNHDHYDNRGVELYAKTGDSSGTLSATLSTTYLQTFGEDGDACATGTTYTFFRGDVFFEIAAGDSFGLQVKEGSNQTFKLFGQTGGPTPGSWMVIEAVQLSD
jgi:hypothetical protein